MLGNPYELNPHDVQELARQEREGRNARDAAREGQGVDADEAAGEEESSQELDAAWAKEKERVEQERQQDP